ncbi:MAG: methionyl-tRNA formyltransferase [Candidatus Euphemobacter frigidus]|nr:methionyl-tRNA formyltransferase [Candidatus Euphemobacter frigidus]MDP8275280.1 methionyl-tRNA formyltransferase [Candidatus Euphemobacter frigidus]
MKIVFMGTPVFALPGLDSLVNRGVEIAAVVTRPDRGAGRGRRLTPSPVKVRALALGLSVLQPERLKDRDFIALIKDISPNLIVVSAYGKFIPAEVLAGAKEGGINLHPSLLPRYRGAAPIQWALINGEVETGVTIISISDRMDAGYIFAQAPVAIFPEDNAETLGHRLAERGGELLSDVVEKLAQGSLVPRPQDESKVTLAPRLSKEDGRINWHRSATRIHNLVRGLYPWPGTFTTVPTLKGEKILKIIRCRPGPSSNGVPGEALEAEGDILSIAAGEGSLRILELQIEGKRPVTAGEFLRGYRISPGVILGGPSGTATITFRRKIINERDN